MRFVNGCIMVLCVAQVLCAQSSPINAQETERARQFLNSPLWIAKAWGAYFAGRLHSDELQQALIDQFGPAALLRDSPSYSHERAFVTVLLDAAIEAGVTVPAALLEPFEEGWTVPVLILLARDKGSEDSLLRLRSEKSLNTPWLAVNNLLLERKSQRWYEAILREVSIAHRFAVTDSGLAAGLGGSIGGGFWGDGVAAMPKGFPPVTLYTLGDIGYAGSVLLAPGPRNAYYKRTVVPTDKSVGFSFSESNLDRMEIRIGYLAQLRGQSVRETERLFHGETHIQYTSIEDFERNVEQSMTVQEQGIRAFIQALEQNGLHVPDIHLRIVPEVNDQRKKPGAPLPVFAAREFDLH